MLVKADLSNAEELLPIQHRAFAALYETYQDQYNPAIETMDYFQSRFARPNCSYYKIVEEGHTVGLVRTTVAEDADQGWLGLIGIDPDHRGKGYGHKAMLELKAFIRQSSGGYSVLSCRSLDWSLSTKVWAIRLSKPSLSRKAWIWSIWRSG
nr:GNAT family N-acetyltransferase [Streptococcus suis]